MIALNFELELDTGLLELNFRSNLSWSTDAVRLGWHWAWDRSVIGRVASFFKYSGVLRSHMGTLEICDSLGFGPLAVVKSVVFGYVGCIRVCCRVRVNGVSSVMNLVEANLLLLI